MIGKSKKKRNHFGVEMVGFKKKTLTKIERPKI
jgi:hypothetical protein